MVLIYAVIHALQVTSKGEVPNFAARDFIGVSRPKAVALLDELAEGAESTIAA